MQRSFSCLAYSGFFGLSLMAALVPLVASETLPLEQGEHLYYERSGTGGDLVVVAAHAYTFPWLADLEDERWTLVAYDPRGRGRSSYIDDASTLSLQRDVEDLDALRESLGFERLSIVGFSFAARIATFYATRYPGRVQRLALLAPAPLSFDRDFGAALDRKPFPDSVGPLLDEIQSARAFDLHAREPQDYCRLERQLFAPVWSVTEAGRREIEGLAARLCTPAYANEWPVFFDRYRAATSASREESITPALADQISQPTLLIHGTADRNAPLGGSREWAWRIEDAKLLILEGQAHALHVEDRDAVVAALRVFFAGDWPERSYAVDDPGFPLPARP